MLGRMSLPELRTERLVLRPLGPDDAPAFHAIWSDPEVIWWGAEPDFEKNAAGYQRLLDKQRTWPAGIGWYWVQAEGSDEILGDVLLQPARFVDGIEIGWHFHRRAWGHGYATEAATRVLRYALEEVGLASIYAIVATTNERSLRVVEKLGMHRVKSMTYADLPHILFVSPAPDA